tara:strand:+ start:75 stop:1085 length:1011 start_codon:yes stop_codon:yes gene_type:complete
MYRAAVIGLGNIGFKYDLDETRKGIAGKGIKTHVSAYQNSKHVDLSGVVEIDDQSINKFKSKYPSISVYKSVSQLMMKEKIDFISICTPAESHSQILNEIIKYPIKGILCEKPIADNLVDARSMINLCEKREVLLTINHGRRWHGTYLAVNKLLGNGKIGKIQSVNSIYPGEVFNIGTHLFDAIRMLIQKNPLMLSGFFYPSSNSTDPSISGWIEFEDNIHCTVTTNGTRLNMIFEIDLIGSEGRIKILNNGSKIELYMFQDSLIYGGFRELVLMDQPLIESKDVLMEAVQENIKIFEKEKNKSNCSGHDGYKSLEISFNMLKSAKLDGEPVELST